VTAITRTLPNSVTTVPATPPNTQLALEIPTYDTTSDPPCFVMLYASVRLRRTEER
jgi:hypothetical protein